jgi:SAM-dependent methyltransferase
VSESLVNAWLAALEERHLADLRLPEVTRALRALSSAYVERRHAKGRALDTAGKRAAFGLFYGPLHFLTVRHILSAVGAERDVPTTVIDVGCGTGVAGAAWALGAAPRVRVLGIDRHPAAIEEARWTYRHLRIDGVARLGDAAGLALPRGPLAIVAAYALNELPDPSRAKVWSTLCEAAVKGARVLVVEPIARQIAPWWGAVAADARRLGGRADE